jgi:Family of unknown function (DUF6334)
MTAIARPLNVERPLLLPDRDIPYRLQDVFELLEDGCRLELVLSWGDSYLLFRVDEDTDSLLAQFQEGAFGPQPAYRSVLAASPWRELVGKECFWTWVAVNQQGYCDGALLSFEGVVPNVLLNAICSSVTVWRVVSSGELSELPRVPDPPPG